MPDNHNINNQNHLSRFYQSLKLSLFWKILAWFWLSMIIIITINLFLGQVNSDKIHFRPLPPPAKKELLVVSNRLTRMLAHSNRKIRRIPKRLHDIYLLNNQQIDYFNRPVPDILIDLHSRVIRSNTPLFAFQKRQAFLGGKPINLRGEEYRIYISRRDPLFSRHFVAVFFKEMTRTLLFSIFIISFPISFLLSWIITRPIRQLQQATQDMKINIADKVHLQKLLSRSDEFGELARDFNDMANHVADVIDSQKRLLSDVSHELRSPLTRLKIALGLVKSQQIPEISNNLNRINLESDRMNEMLSHILTLSKLESQEISHNKEKLDLCMLFTTVINDGRFEAEQRDQTINLDMPPYCEFTGVKEALISAIENILRNAIRYAGNGAIINCQLIQTSQQITLAISDNGPGVEQSHLDKLFNAFYRPSTDRSRASGGAGLGLSIAKRAVEINNGTISAQNLKPNGLLVELKLQLKPI